MSQGLRERKKQEVRDAIAEAAFALFAARGFESVKVTEVAEAANVSAATVFNYFPTKEDLLYVRMEEFERALLAAVRDRPAGESVLDAFGRFLVARAHEAAKRGFAERAAAFARIVSDSPSLLARERQVVAGYSDALAALLAEETGAAADDIRPRVVAGALMAVHRALIDHVRERALAGRVTPRLAADVEARCHEALALLAAGIGSYGDAS